MKHLKESKSKSKKPDRKKLIKELDKLFSQIILKRDKKMCVICRSNYKVGAGHVFSRRNLSTRWSPDNVFAQCWKCNCLHTYNTYPYYNWYINTFGKASFDNLYDKWNTTTKLHDADLKDMIKIFKSDL